jgi:hypothetical protein
MPVEDGSAGALIDGCPSPRSCRGSHWPPARGRPRRRRRENWRPSDVKGPPGAVATASRPASIQIRYTAVMHTERGRRNERTTLVYGDCASGIPQHAAVSDARRPVAGDLRWQANGGGAVTPPRIPLCVVQLYMVGISLILDDGGRWQQSRMPTPPRLAIDLGSRAGAGAGAGRRGRGIALAVVRAANAARRVAGPVAPAGVHDRNNAQSAGGTSAVATFHQIARHFNRNWVGIAPPIRPLGLDTAAAARR